MRIALMRQGIAEGRHPCGGLAVNVRRVERNQAGRGFEVPDKHPRKGRLWQGEGSCLRLRPG